jgi:TonB family protein
VLAAAQFGLISWLGDKAAIRPRRSANEPAVLWLPAYATEVSALYNPTLFVWANPHGFSQAAWLKIPALQHQSADWTEPPRFLAVRAEQLGMGFREFVQKKAPPPFEIAGKSATQIVLTELSATSICTQSTVHVRGDLSGRRLLSQFDLPSWPRDDVLRETEVQVVVDDYGQTQSAILLSSSGSAEADARALELARSAEWEPLAGRGHPGSPQGIFVLSWGLLVFSWHTVPTNNAPNAMR